MYTVLVYDKHHYSCNTEYNIWFEMWSSIYRSVFFFEIALNQCDAIMNYWSDYFFSYKALLYVEEISWKNIFHKHIFKI